MPPSRSACATHKYPHQKFHPAQHQAAGIKTTISSDFKLPSPIYYVLIEKDIKMSPHHICCCSLEQYIFFSIIIGSLSTSHSDYD